MANRHRVWWFGLALVGALSLGTSSALAQLQPAHSTLKHARAQQNREQIFRYLMTGEVPSWMQGKSRAQVRRWGERMKRTIDRNAQKFVRKIVENPSATPSKGEQRMLGLISPMRRAELLRDIAGFNVETVRYKVKGQPTKKYKIRLKRHGFTGRWNEQSSPELKRQMAVYNRVMSPNLITYMPAGGHSKYVSQGQVVDLYGGPHNYGALQPNSGKRPLFPTWLSDGEAQRMKTVFDAGHGNWAAAYGTRKGHGRPGFWPPKLRQRNQSGNSCTTTFIRAPVGQREGQYAWIDTLQASIAKAAKAGQLRVNGVDLSKKKLLDAITGMDKASYGAVFDQLQRQLPRQAQKLSQLKA